MNLVEQKLSALPIGSPIRFTQSNGQIIEGVLSENDKASTLEIIVTAKVTLMYSQIAGIEESNAFGKNVIPVQVSDTAIVSSTSESLKANEIITEEEKKNESEIKSDIKFTCTKNELKSAFKPMDNSIKTKFSPILNKALGAIDNHDESKFEECVNASWNIIKDNEYENNPEVNRFYAYVCAFANEYYDSSISFYYADEMRNAYKVAFDGAEKNDDSKCYVLASVFAAIYCKNKENEFINEAIEVIKFSAEKCNDISALKYLVAMNPADSLNKKLMESMSYLANIKGIALSVSVNLEESISKLSTSYSNTEISEEIKSYDTEQDSVIPVSSVSSSGEGRITKYNFFEEAGKITANDGKVYEYELSEVTDNKLKANLKAISKWDNSRTIPVIFKTSRKSGKDYAVEIVRIEENPKPVSKPVKKNPNNLYTQGLYEEAIKIYREELETQVTDLAFSQIISCYLALWNKNGDLGYSDELEKFTDKYADIVPKTKKSLEILQQYYMKVHDYSKSLNVVNTLLEYCDNSDYGRILHYLIGKERCYRNLHDYQSAIGQLYDWLDIVKRNKMTDKYVMRDASIYIELAELYYELEDYENAEKYANDASDSERKQSLLKKLDKQNEPVEEEITEQEDEDDSENKELIMTLNEAYDEYIDEAGFNGLAINDSIIVDKISSFDKNHLYCLITWLTAVSEIAKKSNIKGESVLYNEFTMLQAIQSIEGAFSYAYQNPLSECEYTSTQIVNLYESSQNLLPKYNEGLMVSAVLRTLFNPGMQDYYLDDLIGVVETSDVSNKYPMLVNLLSEMKKFYDNTGCAIDAFAGYRSNANIIDNVIKEANELCDSIDKRSSEIFESQGQVRRLREAMFSDEQSILRKCLNIVADNKVSEFKYVRSSMEKTFIRNSRSIIADNIDVLKIDAFIDEYWDKAKDMIISEGRHIARPHDKIKGSKRTNIVNTIKKVISCICDWLAVAEHSGNAEESYIMQNYDTVAPQIISMMRELYTESNRVLQENEFDWGTNSICLTTKELLEKMKGTYNAKDKKYFFIGFLSGEDILLDENYLPELEATFCGWGKMNILSRIEHHMTADNVSFEERLKQITSKDESKHNFRSAKLIMEYAEDINDTSLKSVTFSDEVNKCYKLVKQRFETMYKEFCDEVELFENYGIISNMNGEKDSVLKLAFAWYKISRITGDYGFYVRMLDFIKNRISASAVKRGEELTRQLEDLADKPEYDFGIYTKEEILSLIEDQNYTSAESILNCIRRHDTKEVNDYTAEPYRYFSDFISEHEIDCRAVYGAGKSIVDAIAEYSGKKDMEFALQKLTNNARKETKGGAELIRNFPKGGPARTDDLKRLLSKLGFSPVSIKRDENNMNIDSYIVYCQKRRGKVTYVHPIPAFGSQTETEGFRVACLYGKFGCNSLMNSFRMMNSTPKNTLVLLDYTLNIEERRSLAKEIKKEKAFSKTFIVVDRVVLFYLAKHYTADTIAKRLMATTLPFAYCQPFVEASSQTMPPELFTGREDKLTDIESPQGVNLVYGGRQLGKSALLKMAQHNVDKNGNGDRAVWIEVKYKNYKEAAKQLSQELIIQGILDEKCECDNWDDLAKHIKIRLMDENPETRINYLLVMIDEADVFIETSVADDNPPITAVKNIPSDRFKLVLAGTHNLVRFSKEVMHGNSSLLHLSYTSVTQFQRPEAIKLLTNTLAYLGFRFNKEVISNILNKTNFYPGLIQFYCQKLLEAMRSEDYAGYTEINTPYYEISESHFKKVLADSDFKAKVNEKLEASLFTEEKGRSHYHILALILAYLYYEMPAEKKYTVEDILKVAKEYKITRILNIDREKLDELLYEMWDLNVISKEENFYRFATEGFRELLGRRKQVEDEMSKYFEETVS